VLWRSLLSVSGRFGCYRCHLFDRLIDMGKGRKTEPVKIGWSVGHRPPVWRLNIKIISNTLNKLITYDMLKKIYCPTLIIFLQLCFGTAVAQETITVKGKVLDRTGMVLPGASIVVLNENQGAVADFDGEFEIECASDAILAFSYIGFTTQEIPVNGRDYMEVTLEPSTTVMDEVVVVGYGKQKRANLTGAVSSVDYGDQALTRPTTTAAGVLSGL